MFKEMKSNAAMGLVTAYIYIYILLVWIVLSILSYSPTPGNLDESTEVLEINCINNEIIKIKKNKYKYFM